MKYLLIASILFIGYAAKSQRYIWNSMDLNKRTYQANLPGAFIQIDIDSTDKQRIYISGDTVAVVKHLAELNIYYIQERTLLHIWKKRAMELYHVEVTKGHPHYEAAIYKAMGEWREADYNLFEFYKKHNDK